MMVFHKVIHDDSLLLLVFSCKCCKFYDTFVVGIATSLLFEVFNTSPKHKDLLLEILPAGRRLKIFGAKLRGTIKLQ